VTEQVKVARAEGMEEGLATALGILNQLADVMLERERSAKPGSKANYRRRTRIKAYQVAAKRVQTQLDRQRRLLSKLQTPEDIARDQLSIRTAVEELGL